MSIPFLRRQIVVLGFLGAALPWHANAETMNKSVSGATAVHFELPGSLSVKQGNEDKLTIEAEPHVLQKLSVSQKGSTLAIASKGSFSTDKPIVVRLVIKTLSSLVLSGSADVAVHGMSGPRLMLKADGSTDMKLQNVQYEHLQVELDGSGSLVLLGKGTQLNIELSGSGTVDAVHYPVQNAVADISGSGDIKLHATRTLNASISGSGDIRYKGKPNVAANVTGAGSVDKL